MERGDSAAAEANVSTRFHLADAVAEWRSREQLEPSVPSTSPSYFDSDDDEGSALSSLPGPKPADLYGKFTWKIEHFSEISKRELRSNIFEVGGYKWYILVYPQGCDVCNHLSLFLCVADYDKLLPGWSHFAQFTIAVVNKDPKKSKYSDTLHRFCKKEHDWGWKKFMELSKVLDGFTVGDTLIIKAQVQVIRENPHRPFRCLDSQYRRELVRVYLTNVEGICRRFVEEKREKLAKVIEDTLRWSSFRAFWAAVEENARRRLAREKTDIIFKAVVKRFFNEKEVTSTLVMDALYSGCKALDCCNKNKKPKTSTAEETFTPVVWMEKEFFVLAGDILSLLERAVLEPLPSYKDEKGPQNRTKEGFAGDDFGKDYVERDERRLTELGRRTIEMFVLAHLFSNRIEVAYREAVALKRQEELIREEEAAGQAEIELKAKREAAEKEKRSKKKQAKQRRKDRRGKDKDPNEKHQQDTPNARVGAKQILNEELSSYLLVEPGDDEGDSGLDIVDNVVGTLGPAAEDLEAVAWEREAVFVHQEMEASFSGSLSEEAGGQSKRTPTALDDSSSTCSSDSLPSVRPTMSNSFAARGNVSVLARARNRAAIEGFDADGRLLEADAVLRTSSRNTGETSSSSSSTVGDAEAVILSLKDRVRWLENRLQEKEEEVVLLHEQLSLLQLKVVDQKRSNEVAAPDETGSSNPINLHDAEYVKRPAKGGSQSKGGKFSTANGTTNKHSWALENGHHHAYEASRVGPCRSRTGGDSMKASPQKPDSESSSDRHSVAAGAAPFSRPSTAPVVPNVPRLSTPFPPLQATAAPPLLARSISAAGRLSEPPSEALDCLVKQPLSYRNAAVGKLQGYAQSAGNHTNQAYFRPQLVTSSSSTPTTSAAASNLTTASTSPSKLPVVYEQPKAEEAPSTTTMDNESGKASQQKHEKDVGITFGTVTQEVLHSEQQQRVEDETRNDEAGEKNEFQRQSSPPVASVASPEDRSPRSTGAVHEQRSTAGTDNASSGCGLSLLSEDFPHLDIINDLLDDDRSLGRRTLSAILHPSSSNSSSGSNSNSSSSLVHHHHEGADEQQQQARRMVGDREASMMSYVGDAATASNGIPPRYWPLSRSMSVNGVAYRPESQGRYPLGPHHVLVPEGYSVYAPLQ